MPRGSAYAPSEGKGNRMQKGEKVPIVGGWSWQIKSVARLAMKSDGYAVWIPSKGLIASSSGNVYLYAYAGGLFRSMLDTETSEYLVSKEGRETVFVYNGRVRGSDIQRRLLSSDMTMRKGWAVFGIHQRDIAHDLRIMTRGKITITAAGKILPKHHAREWESLRIYKDRVELVSPYLRALIYPEDRIWRGKDGDTRPSYTPIGIFTDSNSL